MYRAGKKLEGDFALLFVVMLVIGAGNTALQSVLPAIGRSLKLPDNLIALAFSVSALVWVLAAPRWARRSDRTGRRRMVLTGMAGFSVSVLLCGIFLTLGIDGVIGPVATIGAFIGARVIYGYFGAAAPPAAQAILASRTTREERTKALTLLASAFGLGTILGPALAPFFVFPHVGLAGPAYVFSLIGAAVFLFVLTRLSDDAPGSHAHGAATSYPSIGGNVSGASVTAATTDATGQDIRYTDSRILPWLLVGVVMGHAQAMTGQAMGFLIIDRLGLPPELAQQSIGIVLMTGAFAALLVQWGLIPLLDLKPRALILVGLSLAALGCVVNALAVTLLGTACGFALASAGFGFARPGYTAGSSLAVGPELQNAVAGKVTSVNGASFVLGPTIGVALYEAWHPLPYLSAAMMCLVLVLYGLRALRPAD
ncbi:Tetracycline resistance protein, class B [Sphingomonas antarctica]|uniref:MFS transporter n=1 Tax=Sphingomonas antarctica TaxID=2040274 RepID=UPI0039EC9A08